MDILSKLFDISVSDIDARQPRHINKKEKIENYLTTIDCLQEEAIDELNKAYALINKRGIMNRLRSNGRQAIELDWTLLELINKKFEEFLNNDAIMDVEPIMLTDDNPSDCNMSTQTNQPIDEQIAQVQYHNLENIVPFTDNDLNDTIELNNCTEMQTDTNEPNNHEDWGDTEQWGYDCTDYAGSNQQQDENFDELSDTQQHQSSSTQAKQPNRPKQYRKKPLNLENRTIKEILNHRIRLERTHSVKFKTLLDNGETINVDDTKIMEHGEDALKNYLTKLLEIKGRASYNNLSSKCEWITTFVKTKMQEEW